MIVYGDRQETATTRRLIDTIAAAAPLERLIRLGQLEAGIVDELCPDRDDCHPIAEVLRKVALGDEPIELLKDLELPAQITFKAPEGYSFYSVYPTQYECASRRFASECRPRQCVVLGIRSIGASLSAVVAGSLRAVGVLVSSWTVRPHGHPFDRKLELSARLRCELQKRSDEWFCIVDEGPGISGSSVASVAEELSSIGVPDDRIVLFPSYDPKIESLRSATGRDRWRRHKKYCEPFPEKLLIPAGARDISGGMWREVTGCNAAVQPQHERRKYLHEGKLWKFAGLAHLGRARFERGLMLSEAGFVPRVIDFHNGFIVSAFAQPGTATPRELLDRLARYLVFLRREFTTAQRIRYADIREMIRTNTGVEVPERDALVEDGIVVAVDGRMMPHEWVGTLKADAIDHYDDHFFPGCQDIAWDIAGAAVEFDVPEAAILDRYLAIENDDTLRQRLPFYRTAYLAFRIGYADMARQSLGDTPDGRKFGDLKNRYTAALLGSSPETSSRA